MSPMAAGGEIIPNPVSEIKDGQMDGLREAGLLVT